jgi:hypothetical protein
MAGLMLRMLPRRTTTGGSENRTSPCLPAGTSGFAGPGSIADATEPASKTVAHAPMWRFRPMRVTIPDADQRPFGRSSGPRRGGRGFASPPPQAPPWRPCLSPLGLRPHQPASRRGLSPSRSNPRRIGRGSAFSRTSCRDQGRPRFSNQLLANLTKCRSGFRGLISSSPTQRRHSDSR